MERLTQRTNGVVVYVGAHNEETGGQIPCEVGSQGVREILARLAEYEDTGLTPEDIEALKRDWSDLCTIIGECGGIDRVRELANADKAGRVVVLPAVPALTPRRSSLLHIIEDGEILEDTLYEAVVGMASDGSTNVVYETLSEQIGFEQADVGKTVFSTREEAEKALRRAKNG